MITIPMAAAAAMAMPATMATALMIIAMPMLTPAMYSLCMQLQTICRRRATDMPLLRRQAYMMTALTVRRHSSQSSRAMQKKMTL